jgi:hypothetical protein
MKVSDINCNAYNAQAVADAKEGVIVAEDANRPRSGDGELVPPGTASPRESKCGRVGHLDPGGHRTVDGR